MSTIDKKERSSVDEKHVQNGADAKKGSLPSLEVEALNGLRTVEVGLVPEAIIDTVELETAETKRILRKVDYRLVPLLALLYLWVAKFVLWISLTSSRIAFVDRTNIGNAKIAGMYDDLNLHGLQYNVALTVFFPPYALLEVPSNVVLKILPPSIWISILMFFWEFNLATEILDY